MTVEATRPTRTATRPRRSPLRAREARAAYGFLLPWIIGFLVFTAGPMVVSLILSFTDYSFVQAPTVGLRKAWSA